MLIGYMPENDAFIANMTAVSFVRMMGELSGLPPDAALERAHEVLFYVGLGEARYRMLGTYSLGMKQLAKLAQAIVHGPQLLILDEPTNGLDPPARQRMIRLIKEMSESGEMHIVLCSHLLRDVEETCEEVLILKQGRIVHYSNLEEERRANRSSSSWRRWAANGTSPGDIESWAASASALACNRIKLVLSEGVASCAISTAGGRARSAAAAPQLSPRHARRYFPEGDGDRCGAVISAKGAANGRL